ncbi:YeeE/YedE family protein [Thorsellia anophelis]|uniref:Sulphur transport domain-containing protein n=1 Tax=Thorsellia anophelis DSM 18579 TaxID=1123402 RepID=A0A1I0E9D0_9GAMM|nr:YeeE/YedE family protein [Thorsellia anophelis]SET41782.1 hypothetical protein SAMN02583745_02300 [Thorsellia anophelis DSM 18579]
MWIDIEAFTPIESLIGGVLIGLAAMILILFCGRVMGISGIIGGIFQKNSGVLWRVFFLVGLFSAPWLYQTLSQTIPVVEITASWWVIILAGLLVGFGTRLGSGCTSGHGVCGLSRFSLRSLASTLIFMIVAILTVFLVGFFK